MRENKSQAHPPSANEHSRPIIESAGAEGLFAWDALSWMNSPGRRRRFGQVPDAQGEGGLAGENGRTRINDYAARGGQIALRVHHVHISAKAMLIGFERSGKSAVRSGDQFCSGLLFAESSFEISPSLPDLPNNRIARMGH